MQASNVVMKEKFTKKTKTKSVYLSSGKPDRKTRQAKRLSKRQA